MRELLFLGVMSLAVQAYATTCPNVSYEKLNCLSSSGLKHVLRDFFVNNSEVEFRDEEGLGGYDLPDEFDEIDEKTGTHISINVECDNGTLLFTDRSMKSKIVAQTRITFYQNGFKVEGQEIRKVSDSPYTERAFPFSQVCEK